MKSTAVFLGVTLLFLGPGLLKAQGSGQLEPGTRASALGGAFIARADDASTVFYNPAGLAFLHGYRFKIDLSYIQARTKAAVPGDPALWEGRTKPFWPSFYLAANIGSRVGIGIGAFSPEVLDVEWPLWWPGRSLSIRSRMGLTTIRPALSVRISKYLAVGAGLDLIFAQQAWRFERRFTFNEIDPSYFALLEQRSWAKRTAFSYVLSALIKPGPRFQIGARYRPKVKLDMKGGTEFFLPTFWHPELSIADDTSSTLIVPGQAALGMMLSPLKNLTLEMDVMRTGTSAIERWEFVVDPRSYDAYQAYFQTYFHGAPKAVPASWNLPVDPDAPPDYAETRVDLDLKNTMRVMFGIEYLLKKTIALRAGYAFQGSAVDDADLHPLFPDLDKQVLSLGIGYEGSVFSVMDDKKTGILSCDVCFQYGLSAERRSGLPALPASYQAHKWLVGLGVGFVF